MNPSLNQKLAQPTIDVYLAIEEQLLINLAKRLKKNKHLLDDIQAWEVANLLEVGSLTQENIIAIAKYSGLAIDEITKLLQEVGFYAVNGVDKDLQEAVRQGFLVMPQTEPQTNLHPILLSYQQQAMNTFNLINTTMLDQSQQIYIDTLNKTVGKVLTGTITPQQALRETVHEWSEKGIPALIDKAGKQWSTEAYVSTVTRSLSNNVANTMQDNRMDEYGVDLIEVSAHMGARPRCAPYQGEIYSRSGKHPKYPPLSRTSYGEIAGLRGINCGHIFYPFIEGFSVKREVQINDEQNDIVYKLSQKQRYLERQIRYAKREVKIMEAMNDEIGVKAAKQLVRDKQANMKIFIDETGRTRRRTREQLYGVNLANVQNSSSYEQIKKRYNEEIVQNRYKEEAKKELKRQLRDGTLKKEIHIGKQEKHIPGTGNFIQKNETSIRKGYPGTSYFTITLEEIQELVNIYSTKGIPEISNKGEWKKTEIILSHDEIIGYNVTKEGAFPTSSFKIHYSSGGTHIVPFGGGRKWK